MSVKSLWVIQKVFKSQKTRLIKHGITISKLINLIYHLWLYIIPQLIIHTYKQGYTLPFYKKKIPF